MSKKLHLIIYIATAIACIGCSTSWDDQYDDTQFEASVQPSLSLSSESLEFSDEASSQQITITTESFWTASTSASWLSLSKTQGKGSGSVTVSVSANNGAGATRASEALTRANVTESRHAVVTFTNGNMTAHVNVTQAGMQELLEVSVSSLAYSYMGGSDNVRVQSNTSWSVSSDASWLAVAKNKEETGFTVSAEQNINTEGRQATIKVVGRGLSHSIYVSQEGIVVPSVTEPNASDVTKHSATCGFSYSSSTVDVTEYGVCYSSTTNIPDVQNATVQKEAGGGRNGSPKFTLSGLQSKTTYYVRAYVVTILGTYYSEVVSFTTPASVPNEDDNGTPNE